jgi:hypothetical protein
MNERFDDLVGEIGDPEERERLRRVHELLLAVEAPPAATTNVAAEPAPARRPRRRPRRIALVAAALAAAAFGAGYLLGGDEPSRDTEAVIPMTGVGAGKGATASIELLAEDKAGNWPMNVVVRGLAPSRDRDDWYDLWLTRDGRLAAHCGRFIVTSGQTEVMLTVPYGLRAYDGWVVTRHGSAAPVLTT